MAANCRAVGLLVLLALCSQALAAGPAPSDKVGGVSSTSVSTAAEAAHAGAVEAGQAAWVHPNRPSLIDKILQSRVWSRFPALSGTHPDTGSDVIWFSDAADNDLRLSHELAPTAAAASTLRNRKVQAGDNELTYIPWRAIKDKSNWKFSWPSPPKAVALAPAGSP